MTITQDIPTMTLPEWAAEKYAAGDLMIRVGLLRRAARRLRTIVHRDRLDADCGAVLNPDGSLVSVVSIEWGASA